jgi:hypothetical protein
MDVEGRAVRLTFDTNCLVALDEDREPEASCIRKLLDLHETGQVLVRMVASSASEKQRDKTYLHNFGAFQARLTKLGLAHIELLKPLASWGVAFWDWAVYAGGEASELEERIHQALFPSQPFSLRECLDRAVPHVDSSVIEAKWRNRKCDVLALWCHLHYGGDIFVTTDTNFMKKRERIEQLGAKVMAPCEAIALLDQSRAFTP